MYTERLVSLDIYPHLQGFAYLNRAFAIYSPRTPFALLQAAIAEQFDTKPDAVNRCMRYAIQQSKDRLPVSHFLAKYKALWGDIETPTCAEAPPATP